MLASEFVREHALFVQEGELLPDPVLEGKWPFVAFFLGCCYDGWSRRKRAGPQCGRTRPAVFRLLGGLESRDLNCLDGNEDHPLHWYLFSRKIRGTRAHFP